MAQNMKFVQLCRASAQLFILVTFEGSQILCRYARQLEHDNQAKKEKKAASTEKYNYNLIAPKKPFCDNKKDPVVHLKHFWHFENSPSC